eukprot:CAMPEP_0171353836 /NCGR_PEP_ID=MMETSP0878-20121228/44395_1 /TAXON_ID=67004 /ORGANISM="Thalassiosira weissflogii, Strain CCMP1336" /LENGTH=1177 /DNA_ID=CAMNT_0011859793 /DNA_START=61 /DNA_END=3595 /DNA_ORIENTATION=+
MTNVELWDDYVDPTTKDVENPPDAAATAPAAADANAGPEANQRRSFSSKKKIAFACVAIAVVAGAAVGIVFGIKSNENGTGKGVSSQSSLANGDAESEAFANEDGNTSYPGDGELPVSADDSLEDDNKPKEEAEVVMENAQDEEGSQVDENNNHSPETSTVQTTFPEQSNQATAGSQATDSALTEGLPSTSDGREGIAPVNIPTVVLETVNEGSTTFYRSDGPLLAKVKSFDQSVVNGYETCSDLKNDIAEALKHFLNQIIMEQSVTQEMYAHCNASNPNWYGEYFGYGYGYDYYLSYPARPEYQYAEYEYGEGEETYEYKNEEDHEYLNEKFEYSSSSQSTIIKQAKKRNANPSLMNHAKRSDSTPNMKHHGKRNGQPAATGPASATSASEDSFHANNLVDGVDSADIVKSNGKHVFAAYGDVIYAWEATDATAGVSKTIMPGNNTEDCSHVQYYYYGYGYNNNASNANYSYYNEEDNSYSDYEYPPAEGTPVDQEDFSEETLAESVSSSPQRKRHHKVPQGKRRAAHAGRRSRKAQSPDGIDEPCTFVSKPRVQSLLLSGDRLTAITVQDKWLYHYTMNYTEPIVSDYSILTVRVYDITEVPNDGSPLEEVGSKEISGDFFTGKSVGDTAVLVTTSYVNTWSITTDVQRYESQYCGLNSTEYIQKAAETAAKRDFDALAQQVVDDLQLDGDCSHVFQISLMQEAKNKTALAQQVVDDLQLDGDCSHVFQISLMQEANNKTSSGASNDTMPDLSGGNLINQFVSILTFDMAADFGEDMTIATKSSGTFTSGNSYLSSLYVTEDFIATVNNGYSYDFVTGESSSSSYILGFNTSTGVALPFCVGSVPGAITNEYSINKYNNYIRIATSEWNWSVNTNTTTSNKIFVLRIPEGDARIMDVVGETEHLGKDGESIYAVRFFEDIAYVVTYQQVDPFIIVDMSDLTDPKAVGELEVPGFSTYLHPIEIDGNPYVLSIGEEWNFTSPWSSSSSKLTLFDVSNPSAPLMAAEFLESNSYTHAMYDFQAIRWLPESKLLILPKSNRYNYRGYYGADSFQGFVVYEIGVNEVKPLYNLTHNDTNCWYEASIAGRSFVFDSNITTIFGHTVISTDLKSGEKSWEFDLDDGLNYTCSYDYSYNYRYNYNYGNEYEYDHIHEEDALDSANVNIYNYDDAISPSDDVN